MQVAWTASDPVRKLGHFSGPSSHSRLLAARLAALSTFLLSNRSWF